MVEQKPSLARPTLPSESDENTAHVSFFILYLPGQGSIPYMVPLPSPEVYSFDWNSLVEPCLPSYVPFKIFFEVLSTTVRQTIIDEGAYISILFSMTWKYLSSPKLVLALSQLLAFNRSTTEPLGVLPQIPITLGGKLSLLTLWLCKAQWTSI